MSLLDCCRLCLKNLADVLLDEDGHFTIPFNPDLQRKIFDCFQILVTDSEIVSKVCSRCHEQVCVLDRIRKRVKKVDFEIKQYYATLIVKLDDDELVEEAPNQVPSFPIEGIVVKHQDPLDQEPDAIVCQEVVKTICNNDVIEKYEFIEVKPPLDKHKYSTESSPVVESHSENEESYFLPPIKKPKKATPKRVGRRGDPRCYICETDFDTVDALDDHLTSHVGSTGKECHLCQGPVTTVRGLNAHLRRVHFKKGKPIPCKECKNNNIVREFSSHFKLYEHMTEEHNRPAYTKDRIFTCTFCGKSFNRNSALKIHENRHTKAITYKCKRCPFTSVSKSALFRHDRVHTDERPFKCDLCPASFNQSNGLHYHKAAKHSDKRPFGCTVCGDSKRFKSKKALQTHMLIHENSGETNKQGLYTGGQGLVRRPQVTSKGTEIAVSEKQLKCDFCPAVYSLEKFLCRHITEKHPEKNVPMLTCELCQAENKKMFFLTPTEQERHVEFHKRMSTMREPQKRDRVCPECGVVCQTTGSFFKHRQTHIKHDCNDCGKTFATRRALRLHVESVHLKLRPYKCDQCDSAFAQFTSLSSHMKTHQKFQES